MRLKRWAVLLLHPCVTNVCAAQEVSAYARVDALAYSAPVAFSQVAADWSRRFYGGTAAVQHARIETGAQYADWGVGLVWRDDGEARFSNDTAELFYLTKNTLPLEPGRRYTVDLKINHAQSQGVRAFRRLEPVAGTHVEAGVSLLRSSSLLAGSVSGGVTALSARDYDLHNIALDYFYSRDTLFERSVEAPQGQGYAFDLALNTKIADDWRLALEAQNLLSRIVWKHAPYTQAFVDTDTKTYDANGYVHIKPLLSGRLGYKKFEQHLDTFGRGEVGYRVAHGIEVRGGYNYTAAVTFWDYGVAWEYRPGSDIAVVATAKVRAINLIAHFPYGYVGVGADRAEGANARFLNITLGFNYPIYAF